MMPSVNGVRIRPAVGAALMLVAAHPSVPPAARGGLVSERMPAWQQLCRGGMHRLCPFGDDGSEPPCSHDTTRYHTDTNRRSPPRRRPGGRELASSPRCHRRGAEAAWDFAGTYGDPSAALVDGRHLCFGERHLTSRIVATVRVAARVSVRGQSRDHCQRDHNDPAHGPPISLIATRLTRTARRLRS